MPSLLLLLLLGAPPDPLDRARQCYADGDLACADAALDPLLAQADLDEELALEVARLAVEISLAAERTSEAWTRTEALLELDPTFAPGDAWPAHWQAFLAKVRGQYPDDVPPVIETFPPASAVEGAPVSLAVRITDPSGAGEVVAIAGRERLVMTSDDGRTYRCTVPGRVVKPSQLLIVIEATDRAGNGPSSRTIELDVAPNLDNAPPASTAGPPSDSPFWGAWWFWTAVGVVAIGGAVAIGVAATAPDDGEVVFQVRAPPR